MSTVSIPADVAKHMAAAFRAREENIEGRTLDRWADLLDPQPPTLRERLIRLGFTESADAVLAVVADWLAAQPLVSVNGSVSRTVQRDHDVRLLRGES